MDIELIDLGSGAWGFRVGGVYQETHPEREGNVAMTRDEAEAQAAIVLARMVAG